MQIQIDLSTVPPQIHLVDAENFKEFSVEVMPAEHAWVDRSAVESLAGALAQDSEWQQGLEGMLKYASSQGWVDSTGAIRAHIINDSNQNSNVAAPVSTN